MSEVDINKLVDRFLAWPLPASVCSDLCATKQGYPHRSGTTLLSAVEAKQMFEYLLADMAPPAVWSRQKPTEPGWYWWRWRANAPQHLVEVSIGPREVMWSRQVDTTMEENVSERGGEWAGPLRPPVEGKG